MDGSVKAFGARFVGRVDAEKLQFAVDYVGFGECGLAFETICDYIVEEDVPISEEEYRLALEIYHQMHMKWGTHSIEHMKALIVREQGAQA
ncbi:MafI family immunity protein [Kosakonia sacchari]|uniref:MafI family immunity protein n=1 Tax=Kosakonia sacchari TaxID=1158459 RepID=UPI0025AF1CF2|nr:MafI family immunity protein [Kosakonia sacchari]MDN2484226.1 MafI family immunity protein [Kosakonia sacchari]